MYRDGSIYDELDKLAISIYIDYGIRDFPIDVQELCKKLGVLLIPYSEFEEMDKELLCKK